MDRLGRHARRTGLSMSRIARESVVSTLNSKKARHVTEFAGRILK